MARSWAVQGRPGIVRTMSNRTLLIVVILVLLLGLVAVRATGGGFLRKLGPMIHGTPGH